MKKVSTLHSEEIARIIKGGRLYRSRSLLVFVESLGQNGPEGDPRGNSGDESGFDPHKCSGGKIAFIAPKRLGSAVLRNRNKRLLRAGFSDALKSNAAKVLQTNNIILMATARTAEKKSDEIGVELKKVFSLVEKDQKEAKPKDC